MRSHEKAGAQTLIMTETELKAPKNALQGFNLGTTVAQLKRKLDAGELEPDATEQERQMHMLARRRYSEDVLDQGREKEWRKGMPMETIKSGSLFNDWVPYMPPRSEGTLYLSWYWPAPRMAASATAGRHCRRAAVRPRRAIAPWTVVATLARSAEGQTG